MASKLRTIGLSMGVLVSCAAAALTVGACAGSSECGTEATCGVSGSGATGAGSGGVGATGGSGGVGGVGGASGTGGDSGVGGASGTGGTGGDSGVGGASGSGGTGGASGTGGTGGNSGVGGSSGTGGAGGSSGTSGTGGTGGSMSGCTAPLAAPLPNCEPPVGPTTGDPAQDCVNRVNQLRAECQCLPPLMRWTDGEACANQQAEYDSTRTPHAGFRANICSGGSGQNECPGWGSIPQTVNRCLQQMWNEGPGEPFIDHGHYINMTNPDHDRVACGFFTTSGGQVWAIQNFR